MERDGVDRWDLCVSDGPTALLTGGPASGPRPCSGCTGPGLALGHGRRPLGGPDLKVKQEGTRLPRDDRALWTDSRCLVTDASSCPTHRPSLRDPNRPPCNARPPRTKPPYSPPHGAAEKSPAFRTAMSCGADRGLRKLGVSPVSRPRFYGTFPLSSDGDHQFLEDGAAASRCSSGHTRGPDLRAAHACGARLESEEVRPPCLPCVGGSP